MLLYTLMYNVIYMYTLLSLSAFIMRGEVSIRYLTPLLTSDYDGNYTPSNRRDWWVTLVAVVYSHVVSLRAARTRKGNLSNKEFMNPSERARPMTHGEMCHMGIVTHMRQKRGTE